MGTFTYAQNKVKAWTQVHVQEDYVMVKSRGVTFDTHEVIDLYELVITNDAPTSDNDMILN